MNNFHHSFSLSGLITIRLPLLKRIWPPISQIKGPPRKKGRGPQLYTIHTIADVYIYRLMDTCICTATVQIVFGDLMMYRCAVQYNVCTRVTIHGLIFVTGNWGGLFFWPRRRTKCVFHLCATKAGWRPPYAQKYGRRQGDTRLSSRIRDYC